MEMFELIPELLRRLRMKQGKTQGQLAAEARVSKSHVSKLENGQQPTLRTLGRILHSQGVDLGGFVRLYREVEQAHGQDEPRRPRTTGTGWALPPSAAQLVAALPPDLEQGFFELERHWVVVIPKPG